MGYSLWTPELKDIKVKSDDVDRRERTEPALQRNLENTGMLKNCGRFMSG